MKTIYQSGIVPREIIDFCLREYNQKSEYDTALMRKAEPKECLNYLIPLIQRLFDQELEYSVGNFYQHSMPYLPHTDYKKYLNNHINVVIPLQYSDSLAHLVIFDQEWYHDSVTWCMHLPVQEFQVNTGVKGSPHEYPVKNLTNKEIDDDLRKYCTHYPTENLFGLSGNAYPLEVGSILAFDNRKIHCTSTFSGYKTGITLRFKFK